MGARSNCTGEASGSKGIGETSGSKGIGETSGSKGAKEAPRRRGDRITARAFPSGGAYTPLSDRNIRRFI